MNHLELEDLRFLSFAEWISGDYTEFVKKSVLPFFNKSYKLKIREIRVLNAISTSEGSNPTASHVSDVLRQDPATITRSLVILIGKGYVLSEEDFSDGRSRILKPTEKGAAATAYFLKIFSEIIDKAAETSNAYRIDCDQALLIQSLEAIARRARSLRESQRAFRRMLSTASTAAFN